MASRFDQPSEPDFDRYEPKPFDPQDEPQDGEPYPAAIIEWTRAVTVLDPAEHAAQSVTGALLTLEQQIAEASDLERAETIRKMVRTLTKHVLSVSDRVAAKCDEILERRR